MDRTPEKGTHNARADRQHPLDPRRRHTGPGGPEEDRSESFEHGGWSVGYWDEQMEQGKGKTMSGPFDLVLGRKTYGTFAGHWSHTDEPGADRLNNATKHVASTTLTELEWENSRLIEGQVPEGIRALKAEEGPELQVHAART
jgi:dihydrofolate reductase